MEHRTIQLVHLSIGFLLASPIVYSAEFAGGTGTAADPYQIATAEQLMLIDVNYYFPSATIISSVPEAPYRGPDSGPVVSVSFLFLASSAR